MGDPVMQWQIISPDPERAATFYAKLFGWEVTADNALGYRRVDPGSERGIGGGFWPSGPEGRPIVQLFVEVENVAASLEQAVALGAKALFPPQILPDGDELAIVLDPDGLSFGLFRPAERAA